MKMTTKIKKAATNILNIGNREATGSLTVKTESKPKASSPSRLITPETIASCAYTLWEQAGRPKGRDVEYWLQAEAQLKQDSQSFSA